MIMLMVILIYNVFGKDLQYYLELLVASTLIYIMCSSEGGWALLLMLLVMIVVVNSEEGNVSISGYIDYVFGGKSYSY